MNIINVCILGLIQGLTEFLPVSSSGHLAIVQRLIPGFSQPGVLFDAVLHFGTVLAVIFYFRKKIFDILKKDRKYLILLMTGTVPVIFVGLAFRVQIEEIFNNLKFVGIALVITGILNFLTDQAKEIKKEISVKNSFLIGIAQAIAIIPGISRSGSTIFASTSLGIKKEKAAEFSFLLSIPAVLGANLLEFIHYKNFAFVNLWFYVSGFIFAFISGIIAINLALKLLKNKGFKIFSYYCLIVGLVVFILL